MVRFQCPFERAASAQLNCEGQIAMLTLRRCGTQVLFDRQRLEVVRRVEMGATVAALLWHERLNQIFVGTGQCLPSPSIELSTDHCLYLRATLPKSLAYTAGSVM